VRLETPAQETNMAHFTQLGLSGEPDKKSETKVVTKGARPRLHFNQKQKTDAFIGTVVAGALAGIFLLQTGGCSKQESKPVASAAANPITLNSSPAPSVTNIAPTPAQGATPAKKVVKTRPLTVSYTNQIHGISFVYPRKYRLESTENTNSDNSEQIAMNFSQPGGVSITRVEVPKDLYLGTDFTAGSFAVSVNKEITEDQCYQFASPAPNSADDFAVKPTQVKVAGMELEEVENLNGPSTNQRDTKFYHVYGNGACYEFALGIETDASTEDDLYPVNRKNVFQKLEKILATVKIQSEAAPEVTASVPQPALTQESAK
jgi:hypothetical protein